MADALDSDQIQTVLQAGDQYNRVEDHQRAYDTVFPVLDGGLLQGSDLGRGEAIVGEACLGLGSHDAAMYYLELAVQHATGDTHAAAERLLTHLRHLDDAQGVEQDGVDGEQEAEALLRVGQEAIEREDFDTAWHAFSNAYNGLRLTTAQLSRAAIGMAACYIQAGQADEAEGYLQIAEGQDPTGLQESIAGLRTAAANIRAGVAAVEGGIDRTELDEVNRAAIAASRSSDLNTAYDLFMRMYESTVLPASDRGRVAVNLAVLSLNRQDYDTARTFLTEAVTIARPAKAAQATRMLEQLDTNDRAAELVAGLDLTRDITADD